MKIAMSRKLWCLKDGRQSSSRKLKMSGQVPLLLVHGVGHHSPGGIESAVSMALGNAGVHSLTPAEFNWDALLKHGSASKPFLDYADMTGLGRAFWTASLIGIEDGTALRLVRPAWSFLSVLIALWVLAAMWSLLAYGASRLTPSVPPLRIGLPWTSYWFPPVPPDLLAPTLSTAHAAFDSLSLAVAVFAGLLTALTWIATHVPLRCALRTGVFQVLWFPVYALGILPVLLASLAGTAFLLGFISTAANLKFTIELPDGTSWPIGPGWREMGTAFLLALGLGLLAAAAFWLAWQALKPVVDVVRYVGDGRLRTYVHQQLVLKVSEYAASPRIVIAAHSLGSVIAVDSLLSTPAAWSRFEHVDLVTAGSPLHRLLARFFPSAYPPVREAAEAINGAYPGLRWVNVYRPTDYVGGSLPAPLITNHRLLRGLWRTHSNYWADAHAVGWLMRHFSGSQPSVGRARAQAESALASELHVEWRLRPPGVARQSVAWLVLPIAILGAGGIVWSQFIWTPRTEQVNLTEWQRLASTEGKRVAVDAVRANAIDTASGEFDSRYDVLAFYYTVQGQVYGAESSVSWLPYATPRFPHIDWSRLQSDLEASSRDRLSIEVVYASSQPRVFVVPKYSSQPSYYGPGRIFFYLLRTLILLAFWFAWCIAISSLLHNLAPHETKTPE
jgi:hypothetical protein